MKVYLNKQKNPLGGIPWTACSPFIKNSRAVLIHRPKYVTTHKISDRYKSHISITGWCGNTMSGNKKFTFLDAPDGLVCYRCEEKAIESGLPTSSEIVGQHVHLGGCSAIQLCCARGTK
jgi:hypothetical protein